MATQPGLGLATATWAVPFTAYYLFLQNRVVAQRLKSRTAMGHTTNKSQGPLDPLFVANRCQVNFIENVPIALILALLAELNGANTKWINYGLGALFALRISHVEFGLLRLGGRGVGRGIGYIGTQLVLAFFTGYLGWLVKGQLQF